MRMAYTAIANMYNPELAERFKEDEILWAGRRVLLAFAVQIKLKRECPPALVQVRKDPPLQKTATTGLGYRRCGCQVGEYSIWR